MQEHKIALAGIPPSAYVAIVVALLGISVGTLYQKRHCSGVDLRTGSVVQFAACAIVYALLLPVFEPFRIEWTVPLMFAMAWAVVVLSVIAIGLMSPPGCGPS